MRAVSTQQQLGSCVLTARTLLAQTLPRVETLGLNITPLQGVNYFWILADTNKIK